MNIATSHYYNQSTLAAQSNLRLAQLTLNCELAMALKSQTSTAQSPKAF